MDKIWRDDPWYKFARRYVDFCTRTSFASVRIEGAEKLPKSGIIMLAPNHRMSLMDPLLILLLRPKLPIGFGARADIFRNPTAAKALNWLRILPIARERDGLREVKSNLGVFDEIIDCMAHKTPFCLFSEGTHRPQRGMMPVKKGIFRICRTAMEKLGETVYVVPVGVDYEEFRRQMGKAAVRVGEPIDLGAFLQEHPCSSEAESYQLLCRELQSRILQLVDLFPERKHGRLPLRCALALASLPLFLVCTICSFPIWLVAKLILSRMEDKAWTHTVVYLCRFLLPLHAPFYSAYALLRNFYSKILEDIRPI